MPVPLKGVLAILQQFPNLFASIDVDDAVDFINLVTLVKPYLLVANSVYTEGPVERLPAYIHGFLVAALRLDDEVVKLLWQAFKHLVWQREWNEGTQRELGNRYVPYFLKEGLSRNLTFHCLLPPTLTCLDPKCMQYPRGMQGLENGGRRRELTEPAAVMVTVFSRDLGPLPATSISLYCRGCHTRYYHNYYVHKNASARTYYTQSPRYVHSTEHIFVDKETCELFSSMMVASWTSATNCARIYNQTIGQSIFVHLLPAEYTSRLKLDMELVWNSLFLFWLLEYYEENNLFLQLDHNAKSQTERVAKGLRERNLCMVGTGQDEWNHACDLCCWIITDSETGVARAVRSVVVDGVTIGRPCCGVHDCKNPLPSVKSRFCHEHHKQNFVCCVTACSADIEPGFQTCRNPEHRRLELDAHEENKAMFQLKRRSERAGQGALPADGSVDFEVDSDAGATCEGKGEAGNRKFNVRFGRRRTHNEELCVASCGIIKGRATFYGSEAPNGVRLFIKGVYPTQASLPEVVWHDNNCQIQSMLQHPSEAEDREYFKNCAMPVDVFHFKSKHKELDVQCNARCNPANWKDLITEDGKWRFNSSAAEQANAWFGKYLAISREMEACRYDFFLDEMIRRYNRTRVEELRAKGAAPYNIPRSLLLG